MFCSRRSLKADPRRGEDKPTSAALRLENVQPDARMLADLSPGFAIQNCLAPLRRAGAVTLVAAPDRAVFTAHRARLEAALGPVAHIANTENGIRFNLAAECGPSMGSKASRYTSLRESCRNWSGKRTAALLTLFGSLCVIGVTIAPQLMLVLLTVWATLTLVGVCGLRTAGAIRQLRNSRAFGETWHSHRPKSLKERDYPRLSLLVPLFRETDIVDRLVKRLSRLEYPRSRLEVLLILEHGDTATAATLGNSELPNWFRVVVVPPGHPQTKPRALNYALDHAKGEIIGVYDAEDAPAPYQLRTVAEAFATADPSVACLQGVLDFYNARSTWLTRCFAIDYATWFRLVLPGLVRLGFVIPLGGTTVFFRRDILEKVGRWDAHNVTEDADLGIRLARRGYRTEFISSVTLEEATATVPTWIRQRSRWIKGYFMTWAVHMRQPIRLLRELGLKRFIGFQILFFGTLSQFVLAPFLWSFWLVLLGFPHPLPGIVPWSMVVILGATFLLCEVATVTTLALAVATPRHHGLIWWVPLMHIYFPLSAFASWKAIWEMMVRPFYWDKTSHGGKFSQPKRHWHQRLLPHRA